MTRIDWFALAFVALMALYGLRKGLIASALSAAGVIGGALVGARLAPHLLSGGSRSPYTPVAALGGAVVLAIVLEAVASLAGSTLRSGLRLPPIRALDSAGGVLLRAPGRPPGGWGLRPGAPPPPRATGPPPHRAPAPPLRRPRASP